MVSENGRVGALFASKAFVQLFVNPLVGKATSKYGYELPFVIGTGFLFLSSFGKICVLLKCIHSRNFKWNPKTPVDFEVGAVKINQNKEIKN